MGSGLGGGVETTVINLARVLTERGHSVAIAAPEGSCLPKDNFSLNNISLIQIPGILQPTAQTQKRQTPTVTESALANLWDYAQQVQGQYDLLVNFAYDWLPFYLTPFLSVPVAHFVSMGSLSDRLDQAIAQILARFPGQLGVYSQAQADTFKGTDKGTDKGIWNWEILGFGLDIERYGYCDCPDDYLAWIGRISPEKGLEDAILAAELAGKPLKIFGKLEHKDYWEKLQPLIEQVRQAVNVEYCGFLETAALQEQLGRSQALLMTPKWIEAFGIVAVEALACGVPVVAYRRGGPAEIVRSGENGWLVEPDDVTGLVIAAGQADKIERQSCRKGAIANYSLSAWGQRFEQWFCRIVAENSR